MNLKLLAALSLITSIIYILLLSFVPAYFYHLRVDQWGQYINHAKSFLEYGNLSNIGYNEYQPVAVLFFISLAPFLGVVNQYMPELNYVFGLYFANVLFIIINAFFYLKITKNYFSIIILSLILVFTGPIILHRFELLLFLFINLSVLLFEQKKYLLSGVFLGIAFCTKLFPIFLAPLFVIYLFFNKKYKQTLLYLIGFGASLILVYLIYNVGLKGDFLKVLSDLKIHQLKPVHIESVYGSILTIIPFITKGSYALGKGDWGIFGIDTSFNILPLSFYNYFFIIPLGVFYLAFLYLTFKTKKFYYENLFFIMLIFLIFSKILTGQYLLWYLLFLPLIDFKKYTKSNWFLLCIFATFMASFLTQFIYPLKYTVLVDTFYSTGEFGEIFWMLFIRNMLLIFILVSGLISFFNIHKKSNKSII